jgi:hypothetical protein
VIAESRSERARQEALEGEGAGQGKARQGKARQGKARQGKARQGKARQDKGKVSWTLLRGCLHIEMSEAAIFQARLFVSRFKAGPAC